MAEPSLQRHLAGARDSQRALDAMLDELVDRLDPTAPTLLPRWTVGHVLTHIARNADSIRRVLYASDRGQVVERYPGGGTRRDADIEAGATRSAGELVADVAVSSALLDDAWSRHTRWDGLSRETDGRDVAVSRHVLGRWREVEVHRADLGLGYGPPDWPSAYVREDLVALEMRWNARRPMGMTGLPEAALRVPPHTRLAWLLGRADIEGLGDAGVM